MTDQKTPTALTRRDLEARIIAKAWKDPNFKQRLLANPKSFLQHEVGMLDPSVSLPDALQVQIHEEAPNTYHLVLPRNPKDISLGEVLGDDLEAVAPQTIAVVVSVVQNVVGNTAQNTVAAWMTATVGQVNTQLIGVANVI